MGHISDLIKPSNVGSCPNLCPSCKVSPFVRKAQLLVARFKAKPPTLEAFNEAAKGYGGSDAHAIMAQHVIRNETRAALNDFLAGEKLTSPCEFAGESRRRFTSSGLSVTEITPVHLGMAVAQGENPDKFVPPYLQGQCVAMTACFR